ncbi:MAG: hypothetical protein JST54_05105 [Deltaproteobacteria bacterium]|nr:hypothetical protein [Deltaproteobacteria bacterium]
MRKTALLATLLLAACIEESPDAHKGMPRGPLTSTQQQAPQASDSSASSQSASPTPAPTPMPAANNEQPKPAGAIFDGALQVVAYKITPATAQPGQQVMVDVFLRATQTINSDEMMFVHVDDSEGKPVRANGDHWPAGHKLPMTQWKPGEVIHDQFPVTLNGFEQSNAAIVWMGFYDPQHDTRMTLTNAGQVKNDGNNRYALAEIPLTH